MVTRFSNVKIIDGLNKNSFGRTGVAEAWWKCICGRIGTGVLETRGKVEHWLEQRRRVKRTFKMEVKTACMYANENIKWRWGIGVTGKGELLEQIS